MHLLVVTVFTALFIFQGIDATPILYKYVNEYKPIWDDAGSGAKDDVSIWRPYDLQAGFYPLGDVAVATHSRPATVAVTVSAQESDALAAPTGFTEIWRDSGSGADEDVRIFSMVPADGYTCLGHIAVNGYSTSLEITDQFRCVKSDYLVTGTYEPIWLDRGSGVKADVGLFSNSEIGSEDAKGIFANTFTSTDSHSEPDVFPELLSSDYSVLQSLLHTQPTSNDNLVIKVFQDSATEQIWADHGSDGKYDVSIWRPEGAYPVGDLPQKGYRQPRLSYTIKAINDTNNALTNPKGYRKIWDDSGSGADKDVAFWEPICPAGFLAIGHAATNSHSTRPSASDMICVNSDHVVEGKWEWIWNDSKTGSKKDVSVYIALAKNTGGQSLQAMGTVACHCDMNRTPYVLDASVIEYYEGKPADKYILTNVDYKFDDRKDLSSSPEELARTIVDNEGSTEQTVTRAIGYSYEETHDWSVETSLELGIEISVTAGVPDILETSVTESITTTTTHTTGESTTTSQSDSIEVEMTVQPQSQKTATVESHRYIADIPYTATLTIVYADGTTEVLKNFSGTYRGAQVAQAYVVLGEDIPLS